MSKRGNVISSVINLGLFVLVNYLFFMTKMTHYWKHPIFNFVFCIFPISLVYIVQAVYFLRQKEEEIPTVFGRVKTILATTFFVRVYNITNRESYGYFTMGDDGSIYKETEED